MKRLLAAILIIVTLTGCFCSCRRIQPLVVVTEKEINNDTYIRLAEGVSKEMTEPGYWQKDGYNETVMTLSQIKKFNSQNSDLIYLKSSGAISLSEYKETIDGQSVKELIESIPFDDDYKSFYVNKQQVGEEYWFNLRQNMNIDPVPDRINVKFGFSVKRDTLRRYPTNDYANDEIDDLIYDKFIMSDYMPFCPVAILHESRDGEWYFISMYGFSGWIEKENVAVCPSRKDWLKRQNPDDFLIVTGKEIRLQENPYSNGLSLQLVPMGTKMPLIKAEDAPESINRRYTYGNYIVKLPVRLTDGSISDEFTLIPSTDDVTVGYMKYTCNNVIEQAMKLQGDIYGWAGSFHSNDCSGIIREIFLCFGLEFPRTGTQQINVSGLKAYDVSKDGDFMKMEILSNLLPGSLLFFQGHIMIYLGMDENEPYVISSAANIATEDMKEGETFQANSVFVASLLRTYRKTGISWLGSLEKIVEIKPE